MADEQHQGDKVLHQDAVEEVISDQLDETIEDKLDDLSTHVAIPDLGAASGSYVQAEATATRTTLNAVLAVLRDANLIPSS